MEQQTECAVHISLTSHGNIKPPRPWLFWLVCHLFVSSTLL